MSSPTAALLAELSADEHPCRHADLLRRLAARLQGLGTPMAQFALEELSASTEAHLKTIELVVALIRTHDGTEPQH